MKVSPDNYYENMFSSSDMITEPREMNGSDALQSIFNDSYGGGGQAKPAKPADVEVTIDLTMEEIYGGVMKSIEYQISEMKHDARNTRKKTERREVQIRPGCDLDQIVIENAGNQVAGSKPSNIVVKLNKLEHPDYKRIGNDLIYTKKISLIDAL